MNVTSAPDTLRPLGLGEVLDRAVTLAVRFFVPLASIYVVFAVPFAFAQYFATRDLQQFLVEFTQAVQNQTAGGKPPDPAVFANILAQHQHGSAAWTGVLLLWDFLVAPLPIAALIDATSALYFGRPTTFAQAYRVALGRWLPLIGVNFLYLGAGIGIYVVALIAFFLVALGVGVFIGVAHAFGIALAIVLGVACVLVVFTFAVVCVIAFETSYFTCVVERAPPVRAFTLGITRVFGRGGLRRALAFGAAYVAVAIGVAIVGAVGAMVLVALLHSTVVAAIYSTVIRTAVAAFLIVFLGIFYFDLRVREEGLDLQLAAQNVGASSSSST